MDSDRLWSRDQAGCFVKAAESMAASLMALRRNVREGIGEGHVKRAIIFRCEIRPATACGPQRDLGSSNPGNREGSEIWCGPEWKWTSVDILIATSTHSESLSDTLNMSASPTPSLSDSALSDSSSSSLCEVPDRVNEHLAVLLPKHLWKACHMSTTLYSYFV